MVVDTFAVLGGVCKVCENMHAKMAYDGENLIEVLRDVSCSWVVIKKDLVTGDQLTGKVQRCILIDGTYQNVEEASMYVDTPCCTCNIKSLCMKKKTFR